MILWFFMMILNIYAECINNCSGVGTCIDDSYCSCPSTDPVTNIRYYAPPTPDCGKYGPEAYGIGLWTFQISWAFVSAFGFITMLIINITSIVENDFRIPKTVKSLCFILINFGFLFRFIYYALDPYSLRQLVHPVLNRILFSIFYPIFMTAYALMLLQWIEICSDSTKMNQGKYYNFTFVSAAILGILFFIVELITSIIHFQNGHFLVYFSFYYIFSGVITLITVPFYVVFGNHFRKHLKSFPGATKDITIKRLDRKILFLSYAPGICIITTFIIIGLCAKFTRHDAHIFLVGESLGRFSEIITLGVFVFALFTKKEAVIESPKNCIYADPQQSIYSAILYPPEVYQKDSYASQEMA